MPIEVDPDDATELARTVKRASDAELSEFMRSDQGAAILDGLVRRMPDVFRSDRSGSLKAVVHWRISGRTDDGEDVYELQISDGRCRVMDSVDGTPTLTLRLDVVNFLKMTTGNANPRLLFMRGRLKARGDLGLTNKIPSLFDVPKA